MDQGRTVHALRAGVSEGELLEEEFSEKLSSLALLAWLSVQDCNPKQCSGDELLH